MMSRCAFLMIFCLARNEVAEEVKADIWLFIARTGDYVSVKVVPAEYLIRKHCAQNNNVLPPPIHFSSLIGNSKKRILGTTHFHRYFASAMLKTQHKPFIRGP